MSDWWARQIKHISDGIWGILNSVTPGPPAQLAQYCGQFSQGLQRLDGYLWLAPWWALPIVAVIVFLTFTSAFAIRMTRIGISVVSGGGGA